MNHLYKIQPILEARVWGGQKMRDIFGYKTDLPNIAEVYHVIAIPGHLDCNVEGMGETLSAFYHNHRELFGCKTADMPVRLVSGNANAKLSIHLHPTDEYALAHEGIRGKHEGGIFFGGAKSANCLLGHNATSLEQFKEWAENGQWDKLLRRVPMEENVFCETPIGTLHGEEGAGEEIFIAWSTNGDVTYRLYDWDRNDPDRPLHIPQVYDNVKIPDNQCAPIRTVPQKKDGCIVSDYFEEKGEFTAIRVEVDGSGRYQKDEFLFMLNVGADGTVDGTPLKCGETLFVPCQYGPLQLEGNMDLCVLSYRDV